MNKKTKKERELEQKIRTDQAERAERIRRQKQDPSYQGPITRVHQSSPKKSIISVGNYTGTLEQLELQVKSDLYRQGMLIMKSQWDNVDFDDIAENNKYISAIIDAHDRLNKLSETYVDSNKVMFRQSIKSRQQAIDELQLIFNTVVGPNFCNPKNLKNNWNVKKWKALYNILDMTKILQCEKKLKEQNIKKQQIKDEQERREHFKKYQNKAQKRYQTVDDQRKMYGAPNLNDIDDESPHRSLKKYIDKQKTKPFRKSSLSDAENNKSKLQMRKFKQQIKNLTQPVWHKIAGDPPSTLGSLGDYAFDQTYKQIWKKTRSGWVNDQELQDRIKQQEKEQTTSKKQNQTKRQEKEQTTRKTQNQIKQRENDTQQTNYSVRDNMTKGMIDALYKPRSRKRGFRRIKKR